MEICVKCFFDNKSEFEKAQKYLEGLGHSQLCISGRDVEYTAPYDYYIEDYHTITQDQLNELTALCPIRPKREISKQHVYSKIAFGIGLHGSSYSPDDMLDDETLEDCKILGLDPFTITLELMAEFGVLPDHIK